ncbi:MAG: tetratricopeptide repeat protein [Limisphaerales bacterium]
MSRPRIIALSLALITLLVYLPVASHDFINYDDNDYVTDNPNVQKGLTWAGVKWAFTTGHASNWHPLTWLSHMLDCELFALNAGAHHFTNVLFHTANVVLLLLLLLRLTGALWPSAFVAALFAWHPLHVESVAWVAERKDVLSTFFALLTLLAYTRYVKENRRRSFWLALIFFALGLMSKPMLVTLPFVLLLLDYWPLQRFPSVSHQLSTISRLVLEKWPFFLLTVISCVATYLTQQHGKAVMTLEQFPFDLRLVNALISYGRYLSMMVLPVNLAVLYPLPPHLGWLTVPTMLAAALLAAISWLAWRTRRESPFLLVGWLWFLGTLVPVIGIVKVGGAALADRYTYIPLIGIFMAIAFGGRDLASRFHFSQKYLAEIAALILAGCLAATAHQLSFWRDSEALFAHDLTVTGNNAFAHVSYGIALESQGRQVEALTHYREAARLMPENRQAHYNLGFLLDNMGRPEEALVEHRKAVEIDPQNAFMHEGLGIVLAELGYFDEAMKEFTEAARLDPKFAWPHFQMGKVLLKQGRDVDAAREFGQALQRNPDNFQMLAYIANVLASNKNPQGRDGELALSLATRANNLTGGLQPLVLDFLGMAYAETGDFTNAQVMTQKAIELAAAAKMKSLESMQQRLELYKNHQPWRESFLATNEPPKNFPAN